LVNCAGWGLIRGLKSYFDVKTLNCREHVTLGAAAINPCMIPTGNRLHANVYAIYLIDTRATIQALLGEPRYLGIVPDFAKIDLGTTRMLWFFIWHLANFLRSRRNERVSEACDGRHHQPLEPQARQYKGGHNSDCYFCLERFT
jgi:hypothetical protein